jgi:ATP-binding cassette subfamily B protein
MEFGLQTMRDLAGTDRVGTNLLGLVQAAERIGFAAKAVKGSYEALSGAPLPAIAHVRTDEGLGHFVVLYRAGKNLAVIADPARGVQKLSREQFTSKWTGYLLLMTPDESRTCRERPTCAQKPLARFLGLLKLHRGVLLEAVVCALLMTLLGISTSYFVQHLVDGVLVRGETKMLNALGIGMVLIMLFRTLFGMLRHYLLAYVGRKVDLSLIAGYSRHLLTLPMNFFEMRQVGEILSRVNDAAKVREAISGAALTAIVDGVVVICTMAVLWMYDIRLAAVATLFAPLWLIVVAAHHPATRRRSRAAMEDAAKLSAHLVEDISGVETIKAYGAERARTEEGEHRLVRLVQSIFSMQKLSISMTAIGGLISGLAGIVILWYGGHRVIAGALTIGELMFFYTLLGYLLEPLERLAGINAQVQDALIAVDRLYQVMDIEAEQIDDRKASLAGVNDAIELRDVSFRYGCRENVLSNLNIRIPAGATVAIVGESGCGKSTLLKLLTRFYDPTAGQVMIDGVNLRDFDLASLRSRIGIVSQEPFVVNGTLRENIALGNPHAELNDIIAAAKSAGLEEFIARLPERYETIIGERGANLSGGERQRLAIARALLRKPSILIFDEATSHLDTSTERAIQENLRGVFADKTVLLVAHRLSTIREADLIYVMHRGQIVEQGDHATLMAQGGRYAQLWRSQTDGASTVTNGHALHPRLHGLPILPSEFATS